MREAAQTAGWRREEERSELLLWVRWEADSL